MFICWFWLICLIFDFSIGDVEDWISWLNLETTPEFSLISCLLWICRLYKWILLSACILFLWYILSRAARILWLPRCLGSVSCLIWCYANNTHLLKMIFLMASMIWFTFSSITFCSDWTCLLWCCTANGPLWLYPWLPDPCSPSCLIFLALMLCYCAKNFKLSMYFYKIVPLEIYWTINSLFIFMKLVIFWCTFWSRKEIL